MCAFLELPDLGHSPVGLLGSAYFISASEPYRVSGERDDPSPTRFHALDYNRLGGVLGLTIAFTPTSASSKP